MFHRPKNVSRTDTTTVTPSELTPEMAESFGAYWDLREKHHDPILYLKKDSKYVIPEKETLTLTHDLAVVKKPAQPDTHTVEKEGEKEKKKEKPQKLRVLDNKELGHGGFGSARSVIGSIKRKANGKIKNKEDFNSQKWVAKIEAREDAERESYILQGAPHFKASAPTPYAGGLSIFFMRRAPGITLQEWLMQYNKLSRLTPIRAAIICHAIIQAYITQILKNDLIHGDITINNIMIDARNPRSPIITFIDLGLGHYQGEEMRDELGAQEYVAPEIPRDGQKSTASDVFALGRLFERFFPQLEGINFLITRMQADNANRRPEIDIIALAFEKLLKNIPSAMDEEQNEFANTLLIEIAKLDKKTAWFNKVQIGSLSLQENTAQMLVHYHDYRDGLISAQALQQSCYEIAKASLHTFIWSADQPVSAARALYDYIVETYESGQHHRHTYKA